MSAVIGSLRADLSLRTSAFNKGVDEATRRLNGLRRDFRRIGRQLEGIGRTMTLSLTAPMAAFGALTLKAGGDFEAAMNKVGAVSGATAVELQSLKDAAKEMGATTQFSASQSADALSFLAMAGFSARQSIDALPGTLQLAASAQMDLGSAADIVSNVLSGYGLQVEELSRVNDVLVKTFTSANTDLRQLGEAMKYAGPIASAAGISFEEAAASIGLMGNAGIQASMAGTSLRGAIGRILEPTGAAQKAMDDLGLTFTDSQGKIIAFDKVIDQLAPHADNAGLFMELFGQRAGPAMAALVSQGSDSLVTLREELLNAGGTAERIAGAQMEGFNGAMKRLASAFEAVQIAIADSGFLEFGTRIADSLTNMLSSISELNPELLKVGTIIAGVAAVAGPLIFAAGALATAFAAVAPAIVAMTVPLTAIAAVAAGVVSAWGPLTNAVGFLRENLILLSPIIGQVAVRIGSLLVPALASAASGFVGLALATGAKLVAGLKAATFGLRTFRAALISTGVGALIVGIATVAQKFLELREAAGSTGKAFEHIKVVGGAVFDRVVASVQMALAKVQAFGHGLDAALYDTLASIADAMPDFVNPIIGAFSGAFEAIKVIWAQLPQAMSNVVAAAANLVLAGTESMINYARDALWNFVQGAVALVNKLPAVHIEVEPLDPVTIKRVEVQATNVAENVSDAFSEAFGRDYTGELAEGLDHMVKKSKEAQAEFEAMAEGYAEAASKPLSKFEAVVDKTEDASDALEEAKEEAEKLEVALKEAGDAGEGLGDKTGRGARKAKAELSNTAKAAQRTKDSLNSAFSGFFKDLSGSGVQDAFSNLFGNLKNTAATSFSDLITAQFSAGGAGFKGIWAGLKGSWGAFKTGLSSIFSGGGLSSVLGGLGSAVSAAMPLIGAAMAVFNVIKGFSSTKVIGGGIKLGVSDGQLDGGTFQHVERKTWWGLKKRRFDRDSAFDAEMASAFQSQIDAIKGGVGSVYESLGGVVSDTLLNSVSLAVERIDTKGLSEAQIQKKVEEVFATYGDAVSNAVGGVDLQSATVLANVQSVLSPLQKAFNVFASDGLTLSKSLIEAASDAAQSLAVLSGGLQALGQKTADFYNRFYSEAEKLDAIERAITSTFAGLGLAVPETDAAFRELVLSQDLMTEAGRKAYATLLDIAPQFDALTDAADSAADALAASVQAERDRIENLTGRRSDTLFSLLGEPAQIEAMRQSVRNVFDGLGLDTPSGLAGLSDVMASLDLSTAAGQSAYEALEAIAPDFRRVLDADHQAQADSDSARLNAATARDGAVLGLLPTAERLEALSASVSGAFGRIGQAVPQSLGQLADVLRGFDLTSGVGRSAFEIVNAIIPAFKEVQSAADAQRTAAENAARAFNDAVANIRGEYSLDAGKYRTEFEARLAHEIANGNAYSQEVINGQNAQLAQNNALLETVVNLLKKQNKISGDSLTLSALT